MTTFPSRRYRMFWTWAAAVAIASVGLGRSVPGQGGGSAVTVDFVAITSDGRPVADLKAEEVMLRVAGKARPIKSLQLVIIPASDGSTTAAAVPAPFATNTGGGGSGRSFLIVVEDESLQPAATKQLREDLTRFLESLSPSDRVAFSTAPRDVARLGADAGIAKVKEAITQVAGRQSAGASTTDRACRSRDTLLLIRGLLSGLAGAESPTTVIVFSSEMSTPSRSAGSTSGGQCEVTTEHYQALGPAAAAARANFYVVQQDPNVAQRNEGLENLAGITGAGQVLRLAGTTSALGRIAAETSAYYVATIDADASDRAGQSQRLEVRVTRDGVVTRARPDIALTRTAAAATPATPATPRDMIRVTGAFRNLPLRAVGYASRAGDRMAVLAMAEPAEAGVKLAAASVALIDPAGKIVVQATADEKQLAGSPLVIALPVAPGRYRMRFAATDASGRAGAVDYDVVAELTSAGSLKLGALVLTAFRNNSAVPAVQFRDEEKIIGILEMYGELTGKISARMEVASSLDGPAIATIQPGGQKTNEADKFILTGEIPIASLAPGDYVVRAIVSLEGQPEGKVTKTFRKIAK